MRGPSSSSKWRRRCTIGDALEGGVSNPLREAEERLRHLAQEARGRVVAQLAEEARGTAPSVTNSRLRARVKPT